MKRNTVFLLICNSICMKTYLYKKKYSISFKFPNFYFFEFCSMSTRPCVLIQAVRAVKLPQYVIGNLNLKGSVIFYTHALYMHCI